MGSWVDPNPMKESQGNLRGTGDYTLNKCCCTKAMLPFLKKVYIYTQHTSMYEYKHI